MSSVIREHAETLYADELVALEKQDDKPRPPQWKLSPWAVTDYLLGTKLDDGTEITAKYIGDRRLMEVAVATLATDRALLLLGVPGTAKSWVSEHLTAAITGDSTLLIQGTSGIGEEALRYNWNYALASDVQDTLITLLSEKTLPIPELSEEVQAREGFNVIASANSRDRGVNELSSALQRRFNTVVLPLPKTLDTEVQIVQSRVESMAAALALPAEPPALEEIRRVVTIFRELRSGVTEDGQAKVKSPSGTLSTAEAISVVTNGLSLAGHFGNGTMNAHDLATGMVGAIIKDPSQDPTVFKEYLETVVKERDGWSDLYRACSEQI